MLNIVTLKQRLEILQIKLWNKYLRAPATMLSGKIFNNWKKYMFNNENNEIINYNLRNRNSANSMEINLDKFNHMKKSPLTRMYLLIKYIIGGKKAVILRQTNVNKSPPCYEQEFPSNISTYESKIEPIENSFVFYTDGSMDMNPGPGAGAFWSPNFIIPTKMKPILHDTTINYAELSAFELIFESLLNTYKNFKIVPKNVVIYTDSLFCLNIFSIDGYAKYQYYYKLVNKIFSKINELNNIIDFEIQIIKIKSHTGIDGNEIVDGIAKHGAKIAKECKEERYKNPNDRKYPGLEYNTYFNPIIVDNSLLINKLETKNKICNENSWNSYFHNPTDHGHKFIGNGEFIHSFPKQQEYFPTYRNQSKHFLEENKYLKADESAIINKLRTEHINLNNYENFMFPNNCHHYGLCEFCQNGSIESVRHFLIECPKFENERDTFFKKLRNIHKRFKFKQKISVQSILFPFTWQRFLKNDEPNYKEIYQKNIKTRLIIYEQTIDFINKTNRFKQKHGM